MPDRDRATPCVHARVFVVDAEVVEQREHLHRERLVEFEQPDVGDRQAGLAQRLFGRRNRADTHDLGLDARESERHHAHLDAQAEVFRGIRASQQRDRRAVGERRGVARAHPAVRAERGLQRGQTLHRGFGPHALVFGRETPALGALDGDRDEVGLDLARRVRCGDLLLASHPEPVGTLLRERREAVVQTLGRVAHVEGLGVDELFGEEPRVRVDALAHRVVAHVLDATGDADVVLTEADHRADRGDRRHRAGAHPVDREAGNAQRQTGEDGGGAAEREALVADLRGGCDGDIVDAVLRQVGVALEEPDHRLDDQVVGAGVEVLALLTGPTERGTNPIHEYDVGSLGHGAHFLWLRTLFS